jgi:hypothetical protein
MKSKQDYSSSNARQAIDSRAKTARKKNARGSGVKSLRLRSHFAGRAQPAKAIYLHLLLRLKNNPARRGNCERPCFTHRGYGTKVPGRPSPHGDERRIRSR